MASSTVSSTVLSVGLLVAEIRLKKASDTKGTSLSLATPDGHPVSQRYLNEETGELFLPGELTKGVFSDGEFKEVPKDQLAAIDAECALDSLEIVGFLPASDVPWERAEGSYFLAPGGKAGPASARALAILRDAMVAQNAVGYGRLTLRTKTRVFVVYVKDGGLMVSTLMFAAQSHAAEAGEVLEGVEAPAKAVALAETLIEGMQTDLSGLDALVDDRTEKRESLVAKVLAGKRLKKVAPVKAEAKPVDDLEALLAASVEAQKAKVAA